MTLLSSGEQVANYTRECRDITTVTPTRYHLAIDQYVKRGGMKAGQLWGLIGRSGVGKTAWAVNLANRMVEAGLPVCFSTQEMTTDELVGRLIAVRYGLDAMSVDERVEAGDPSIEPYLSRYEEDFQSLVIYDKKRPTFDDLADALDSAEGILTVRPQVIIQDYMQLMSREMKGYPWDEGKRVPRLAEDWLVWVQEQRVAGLVLCQTGRANEGTMGRNHGHVPLTKEDIMYGGEQSFGVILGLFRPELDPDAHNIDLEYGDEKQRERWQRANQKVRQYKDKVILQLVKNRYGKEHFEGEELDAHWPTMQMVEKGEPRFGTAYDAAATGARAA